MRLGHVEQLDCKHLVAIVAIGEPPEIRKIVGPEWFSARFCERERDLVRGGEDSIRATCRTQRLYTLFPQVRIGWKGVDDLA